MTVLRLIVPLGRQTASDPLRLAHHTRKAPGRLADRDPRRDSQTCTCKALQVGGSLATLTMRAAVQHAPPVRDWPALS
jgi:hypothetical protein